MAGFPDSTPAPARRSFLRGLATLSLAGGAAAAPALAAALTPESPELLAYGPQIDEAERRLEAAVTEVERVRPIFDAAHPPLPDELVHAPAERNLFWSDHLMDMEYGKVAAGPRVIHSTSFEYALEGMDGRTRRARSTRHRLTIARAYEQAVTDLRSSSGADAALSARRNAVREIERIVGELANLPACTLPGVVLKARAMVLLERAVQCDRGSGWPIVHYAPPFLREIAAIGM